MKSGIINTILCIFIIALFILIAYRFNNTIEDFELDNKQNTIEPPPTSTYNLQQYIETNPPTGSKVIKREISHSLPDLMDKDITMKDQNQIRFGTMRGELGSNDDTFYLQGVSDQSEPHLKLIMGDKKDKNSSFRLYGGACETHGNCSLEGNKLYEMDSQPNFKINDRKGDILHSMSKDGNYYAKGNILANEGQFRGDLTVKGNINLTGKLNDGTPSTNDANKISRSSIYTSGTVNAQDHNVRGRLYFSNAQEGDIINHQDKRFYSNYNKRNSKQDPIWRIHNSDPYYIEKVKYGNDNNRLRMTINDNDNEGFEIFSNSCKHGGCRTGDGERVFEVRGNGYQWNKGGVNADNVNVRGRIYFSDVGPGQNPNPNGKNNPLFNKGHHSDPVYIEKVREGTRSTLRITINDDSNDALEIWGDSCRTGNCRGKGRKLFLLNGNGDLHIAGKLHQGRRL